MMEGDSPEALMSQADASMYERKRIRRAERMLSEPGSTPSPA